MFKDMLVVVGGVILAGLLLFGISFGGYEMYNFFAPKYRAADNKVFKESEQYNDGMIRDLENLQMEYVNSDADKKQALRAIVLHRFSVYPQERMPANLRNFYNQVKSGY
jgi:hypothetical protein